MNTVKSAAGKSGTIAYLEDDPQQTAAVAHWLAGHGYEFQAFDRASAILEAFSIRPFAAVILDWELETGGSGLDVLTRLRNEHNYQLPVLMLSAKNSPLDIQQALGAGATEFLSKPVRKHDLLTVIDRFFRPQSQSTVIDYGLFIDDTSKGQIAAQGTVLDLTPAEYKLASGLLREHGRWIPFDRLLAMVEGELPQGGFRGLDLFVLRLKKKMGFARCSEWRLEMVYGHGYRLVNTQ